MPREISLSFTTTITASESKSRLSINSLKFTNLTHQLTAFELPACLRRTKSDDSARIRTPNSRNAQVFVPRSGACRRRRQRTGPSGIVLRYCEPGRLQVRTQNFTYAFTYAVRMIQIDSHFSPRSLFLPNNSQGLLPGEAGCRYPQVRSGMLLGQLLAVPDHGRRRPGH